MFKLDDNLLIELGLGSLPATEKNRMLSHIYETLEMRVGMKLAQRMTNEQLDEFEAFIDRNDEAGALKWLESNFPNYKQVVADELEALKAEIKAAAPQIVAASQQAAAGAAQVSSPSQPQFQAPAAVAPVPQQYQSAPMPSQPQPMAPAPFGTNPTQSQMQPTQQYQAPGMPAAPTGQPMGQVSSFDTLPPQQPSAPQSQFTGPQYPQPPMPPQSAQSGSQLPPDQLPPQYPPAAA